MKSEGMKTKEEEEIVDYHEDSEEDKAMYAYTHVFYYPIL